MSAAAIIERARTVGVTLRVEGREIKVKGPVPEVEALLPALRVHKGELLAALSQDRASAFDFSPLDSEAVREVLQERIGILMDSGMPQDKAEQEAGWQLERDRCWERFQSHAQIILDAPERRRRALLAEYQLSAARMFGEHIAGHMAATMTNRVRQKAAP